MEKKIMISVDDSMHAKFAVRYCTQMALKADALKLTLFNVQAPISQFLIDECKKSPKLKAELDKALLQNREKSQKILTEFMENIVHSGVAEARISTKSIVRHEGIARDMLKCCEAEHFDALVLGRRGISALQEMFMGSVTSNIIQHNTYMPIWLVGGDAAPKNILVPVDGSENSLRAVDHLAFIMSGSADIHLTLFHVKPRLTDLCKIDLNEEITGDLDQALQKCDQQSLESFYPKAMEKFNEAGISPNRVTTKTKEGGSDLKSAIFKEINSGHYDTIVLGRRGVSKRFFSGSVSNYLINKINDRVIWLVP